MGTKYTTYTPKALVYGKGLATGSPAARARVRRALLPAWDRVLLALLVGTAVSGWVLTALQISASAQRPLTRGQARTWEQTRDRIGACLLHSDAARRPSCEARHLAMGPAKARDVVVMGLVTPLLILVMLFGLTLPLVSALVFAATRDREAARRRAVVLWTLGMAATGLVAWIGVVPDASLAMLAGQAACLLTLGASLIPFFGTAHSERLRAGVRLGAVDGSAQGA